MRILAIANEKGGIGKTSITMNIGAGLVRRGKKVLLVDLDTQGNLSQYALPEDYEGVEQNPLDMAAVVFDGEKIENVIRPISKNFFLIPAGSKTGKMDATNPEKFKLDFSTLNFDFIILDCPPGMRGNTIAAIKAADGTIIPATADQFSYNGVEACCRSLATLHKKLDGILLNKYIPRLNINKQIAADFESFAADVGGKVYNSRIRDSVAVRESQLMGQDIYTYAKHSGVAADFAALVKEILKEG